MAIVDGQYPASYFPNTELLGADEMRITALGTGMPNQTKAAVSIAYLVELGNGDKFLFDMGMGSMGNRFSLRPAVIGWFRTKYGDLRHARASARAHEVGKGK